MNPGDDHGSPCLTPGYSESQLVSQSPTICLVVDPVEGVKPASNSSSGLRTDDEGVSQNTFYTAQQSIVSFTAENKSSHNQRDCWVTGDEIIGTTPESALLQKPVLSSAVALDSALTALRVREEVSLLIVSKDRLELILGCSDLNVLELKQSCPEIVDQDVDVTDAAVASMPFVDAAQTAADLPEEVTSGKIPCILYLPTSSTIGESSSPEHNCFVADDIAPDENSSLGSHESYFTETDPLTKSIALDDPNTTEASEMRNGPIYASMISVALEEHAASLDRIRLHSRSVDEQCPGKLETGEAPRELELAAPSDETQEEIVEDGEYIRGDIPKLHVRNDPECADTGVRADVDPNAHKAFTGDGNDTPAPQEQFESYEPTPVSEVMPENLKQCGLKECSHLQGAEGSNDDETETFRTADQTSWEQDVFGLSVSEVKADIMLVLEEVTGASPVNTSSESYQESYNKICGGCGWLARLMCW